MEFNDMHLYVNSPSPYSLGTRAAQQPYRRAGGPTSALLHMSW